jgi:predicted DCC family thiol-disulfide oxidoreductase YuxK
MPQNPIILYDNRCLFCINIKNRFDKFDRKKNLNWVGIDDFDYKKYRLKKEKLLEEIHLIQNGRVYKGYYAFKQICKKIPILFPLYITMLIPGIDFIGDKIYKFVAKHRYKIS